jgi:hypothetical protein
LGNTTDGASTRRNGGSYGGIGGLGNAEQNPSSAYGSFRDPNELGSGGGSDSGPGGNGGGLIRITADTVALNGQLSANGVDGSTFSGGGSGGGIKIVTATLRGTGSIRANGGGSASQAGGGGGGRIALYYADATGFAFTNVQAYGGRVGFHEGTPGTIYLQQVGSVGELIVDGGITNNIATATPLFSLAAERTRRSGIIH